MTPASGPRVSAIITAYNVADYLGEAIESVLAQTRPLDEIVVIDDGSTDGTPAIVAGYAGAGVRYVRQDNCGAGGARNRGIEETTGEWIAFLDGDDFWLPDKTARQLGYLAEHPGTGLVVGGNWVWDVRTDRRRREVYALKPGSDLSREILIHNAIGNPSMALIRRDILSETGPFDASLPWGQDWELWIRIALRAKVGFIPDPVMVYRSHPANLSHQRQWERLDLLIEISRRAIQASQPAWRRPILLARAWSKRELDRAWYLIKAGLPSHWAIPHAVRALLSYPFDATSDKLVLAVRCIVGEAAYRQMRSRVRPPADRMAARGG